MAFLVKALFPWNECSKNADISVLSNFLAIFFGIFSLYRETLPCTIHMPNFRSFLPFKQKLQRGGGGGQNLPFPFLPYQSANSPAWLGLTLLPTGGFLSHTTIVLAATLKPLKLWLPNFVTSCFYLFATI